MYVNLLPQECMQNNKSQSCEKFKEEQNSDRERISS